MGKRLQEIEIGDWFITPLYDERFEIVAMDESARTVEIQYYDGTVEEIDFESWPQLEAAESAPPDDESGVFDGERDDPDEDALPQVMRGEDDIDYLLY